MAYQMAAAYRSRVFGIENASLGRGYGHRPEAAFIVGHIRGDGAFNSVGGVGHGVVHADINALRNRLGGAREVHREVIPLMVARVFIKMGSSNPSMVREKS